jgi:hypothetical protein
LSIVKRDLSAALVGRNEILVLKEVSFLFWR